MPDLNFFREKSFQEGLETQNKQTESVAEGAKMHAVTLKTVSDGLSNRLLVDKYRTDYETVILNTDDIIDRLMLLNVLTIDNKDPYPALEKLVMLNQSKVALDRVMKFVDSK